MRLFALYYQLFLSCNKKYTRWCIHILWRVHDGTVTILRDGAVVMSAAEATEIATVATGESTDYLRSPSLGTSCLSLHSFGDSCSDACSASLTLQFVALPPWHVGPGVFGRCAEGPFTIHEYQPLCMGAGIADLHHYTDETTQCQIHSFVRNL